MLQQTNSKYFLWYNGFKSGYSLHYEWLKYWNIIKINHVSIENIKKVEKTQQNIGSMDPIIMT